MTDLSYLKHRIDEWPFVADLKKKLIRNNKFITIHIEKKMYKVTFDLDFHCIHFIQRVSLHFLTLIFLQIEKYVRIDN